MATPFAKHYNIFAQPHLAKAGVVCNKQLAAAPSQRSAIFARVELFPPSPNESFCITNRGNEANARTPNSGVLLQFLKKTRHDGAIDRSSETVRRSVKCQAHTGRRRAELVDFDHNLYELLGVGKDASPEEIKGAYRWLQKKCHPDIAGAKGHDMAILLNEAYAVLSDPDRRAGYDSVCVENAEFAGFTGELMYSSWYAMPGEDRAVFVEETQCVGCLKCALIAPNTFAIESKYGRARAVTQWLDEEDTIKDAIRACPVDCISWVDRELLPALEFVMSKQPRLLVGIDNYSYVGVRQENVFEGAKRFLEKYARWEEVQTSTQETMAQREARMTAAAGIHTKAGRWWNHLIYTHRFFPNLNFTSVWEEPRVSHGALIPLRSARDPGNSQFLNNNRGSEKFSFDQDEDLGPLLEAARKRRGGRTTRSKVPFTTEEEYWTPMEPISCPLPVYTEQSKPRASSKDSSSEISQWTSKMNLFEGNNLHAGLRNVISTVPIVVSISAAVLVGMTGGTDIARSETDYIITGPLPASVMLGMPMQIFLTAVVWYMIGAVFCAATIFLMTGFIALRAEDDKE